MNHTPQIKKAIEFAAKKHQTHVRNGADALPYVTHLFSVALLVAEDGADDDIVCAALLHDVVEDTGTSWEEVAAAFNQRVADMVAEVSEPKDVPWKERKQTYLAQVEAASEGALLIATADKIDNLESKIAGFQREGGTFLGNWRQPPADYIWFNGEALRIAQQRIPEHRLTKRLASLHEREKTLFGGA